MVLRWVRTTFPDRWGESTLAQFAGKLLSAGAEAELVSPAPDPRKLPLPRVTDEALAYLLFLLREIRFEGSLTDNPYLHSVGLTGTFLDHRLRSVGAVQLRRVGNVSDFTWAHADLARWAETLS